MNFLTTEQRLLFLELCRDDIAFFAKSFFNTDLRPKQMEFLNALKNDRRITFRGGVGFGKTHALAVSIYWGLFCFNEIQISVYGPTEGQLKSGLWKELKLLYSKMPKDFQDIFDISETSLKRAGTMNALAELKVASKEHPEASRGSHMTNNWAIIDEASGFYEEVFSILQNIFSDRNPKMILVSNPTRASGFFYETFENPDITHLWTKIHGKTTDNPDITPETLAEMIAERGGPLSQNTRINIHGEFPLSDIGGVIPQDLILAAAHEEGVIPVRTAPIVWGIDVAGPGGDRSVLIARQGAAVLGYPHSWQGLNLNQLSYRVRELWEKTPKPEQPR